jgi:hypothetical protein
MAGHKGGLAIITLQALTNVKSMAGAGGGDVRILSLICLTRLPNR